MKAFSLPKNVNEDYKIQVKEDLFDAAVQACIDLHKFELKGIMICSLVTADSPPHILHRRYPWAIFRYLY